MLREDFQAAFARLSGVLQGGVGDQSLAVLYFQGDFFLQGASMLCNVWDVLAPLQHWDYKFYWRRGGLIDTHTLQDTHKQKISSEPHITTLHQSQHQKETEL